MMLIATSAQKVAGQTMTTLTDWLGVYLRPVTHSRALTSVRYVSKKLPTGSQICWEGLAKFADRKMRQIYLADEFRRTPIS